MYHYSSKLSMPKISMLKQMFMSVKLTFRPRMRKFPLERKCKKLHISFPLVITIALLFMIPAVFSLRWFDCLI